MKLKKIDLTKKSFSMGAQQEGLINTSDHPDINVDSSYLCKIYGNYFVGSFSRVWFGLNFEGWYTHLQYDMPCTNHSNWQEIWEIVEK